MSRKIGLFFGSFNPIHIGHLIIADYVREFASLDEVWLIVTPQNPFKEKKNLANMFDRLEMANLAIANQESFRVSDIEFNLPQPSYTIDTLTHLSARNPNVDFLLIMGEDNLIGLPKWKNFEIILRDYSIIVYPRLGYDAQKLKDHPSVLMTDTPQMEISSTFIRYQIKNQKSVRYLVPEKVIQFIDKKGLYVNRQQKVDTTF